MFRNTHFFIFFVSLSSDSAGLRMKIAAIPSARVTTKPINQKIVKTNDVKKKLAAGSKINTELLQKCENLSSSSSCCSDCSDTDDSDSSSDEGTQQSQQQQQPVKKKSKVKHKQVSVLLIIILK